MPDSREGRRRDRPSIWVRASYAVLAVGTGAFFLVAWNALEVVAFARNLMEIEADWARARHSVALHLQGYALSGSEEEWEAYEEAVGYIRALRPSIEVAVAHPGDAERMRQALASDSLTSGAADYWAEIVGEYGSDPEVEEVSRIRRERSRMMEGVEELAEELRRAVDDDGPASPAAVRVAEEIRAANAEIDAIGDPFWEGILDWATEQERSTFRALVSAGLIILLGGILVMTGAAGRSRRAEEALMESETRFRQLAEHIREVFWLTDPDKSRMLYLSPGFEDIWGRPVDRVYDDPGAWLDSIHPEDRDRVRSRLGSQARGDYDEEYRIVTPDGSVRWIRDRAFPVRDETGEVIRIAGLAEDVTQRRELEKEVVQAQRLKAVGRLAGGLGHEFNNLLTVIRGHLDLLSASHGGDPEVARDVAAAEDAARKAGALTQRLLSFGRRQMLSPSTLDLAAFVRETGAMVRRDLREEVEIEIRAGEAIPVRADPAHLRDVLLTLVSYARDRISDGGRILLSARLTEVESPLIVQGARFPAGRWGVVAVEDDGEAIPEDVALRLFEPFALEGDDEGPRLDLASVHGVVEQSGGGIEVVSDPEIGTRFTVYLPAGSAEGEPAGVSSAASSAPGARDDERP